MTPTTDAELEAQISEDVGEYFDDPLGFVEYCFPWGEKGTALENYAGPDEWQRTTLTKIGEEVKLRNFDGVTPVAPIRIAIASGHGIGKSTLTAWIAIWIMSTRPDCKGTVTANTFPQLETKTWAQIQKWFKLSITASWFEVSARAIYRKGQKETWNCSAQTCREENSESFAGQHAADSTSFYIFDEASNIPDKIFEVAEGGLSDGEPMIFLFGNATRSTGKFYRTVFGADRHRWTHFAIDSRTCAMTNKAQIEEWILDHGEDSDFVRVRVRGLPPRASDLQFIDSDLVFAAQNRKAEHFPDDPLVLGVDIARGGNANTVMVFRCGADAASIPSIRLSGEQSRDSMRVASKLADVLGQSWGGRKVAMAFVDSGFGGPIVDRMRQLGYTNVMEVGFGSAAPDHKHFANMRAWMWNRVKDWLAFGSISKEETLETDLTGPGYYHDKQDRLLLESKEDMLKRGLASPDEGDGLALTFAAVVPPRVAQQSAPPPPGNQYSWMG